MMRFSRYGKLCQKGSLRTGRQTSSFGEIKHTPGKDNPASLRLS